jgi:hypothetical protein
MVIPTCASISAAAERERGPLWRLTAFGLGRSRVSERATRRALRDLIACDDYVLERAFALDWQHWLAKYAVL